MNEYCLHTFIKSKNCKSNHCKLGLSMYVLSLSTSLKILVLFSRSVVSYSLRPHGLQHTNLSVIHHLPKFAQTQVHQVNDAIQPSHPLSPPSPPALSLSLHQVFSSELPLYNILSTPTETSFCNQYLFEEVKSNNTGLKNYYF